MIKGNYERLYSIFNVQDRLRTILYNVYLTESFITTVKAAYFNHWLMLSTA